MQFLRDFLNDGPKRTAARDAWIDENVMPFIPPELRGWLTVGDAINPVSDIRRAGESARVVANPDRTTGERVGALGDVLVDSASVLAPAAAAKYSGKAAQGVVDALAMASMPADDAAQRFIASEAGNIGVDPVARRGDEILSLVKTDPQRVTDEMLDLGDPVLNTRLNEYLFRNYDLPMDEASRMARAGEMGLTDRALHGGDTDIVAFDSIPASGRPGVYTTGDPTIADVYARKRYDLDEGGAPNYIPVNQNPETVNKFNRGGDYRVEYDPTNIRSRFARFDPRLSHLRNLNAGLAGGATVGGLLMGQDAQAQETRLSDYLNQ